MIHVMSYDTCDDCGAIYEIFFSECPYCDKLQHLPKDSAYFKQDLGIIKNIDGEGDVHTQGEGMIGTNRDSQLGIPIEREGSMTTNG